MILGKTPPQGTRLEDLPLTDSHDRDAMLVELRSRSVRQTKKRKSRKIRLFRFFELFMFDDLLSVDSLNVAVFQDDVVSAAFNEAR